MSVAAQPTARVIAQPTPQEKSWFASNWGQVGPVGLARLARQLTAVHLKALGWIEPCGYLTTNATSRQTRQRNNSVANALASKTMTPVKEAWR